MRHEAAVIITTPRYQRIDNYDNLQHALGSAGKEASPALLAILHFPCALRRGQKKSRLRYGVHIYDWSDAKYLSQLVQALKACIHAFLQFGHSFSVSKVEWLLDCL